MKSDKETSKVKIPFFKQWWFMLALGIVIGTVVFNIIGGSETSDPVEVTTTDLPNDTLEDVDNTIKEEEEEVEKDIPEETAENDVEVTEEDPVEVYVDDDVVISFKELDENGVTFLMENKTDKELTVQSDSVAVNGFSSGNISMSDSVAPKSKGYITARTDELSDVGKPETISGKLNVIDFTGERETLGVTFSDISVK